MSTNINPEIEKVSFIGADRSANIILTLDGEPDYIFYRNQNGQTVRTGANLVDIICRLNKLSNKPITRDDFKNVLRTAKDPITKKSEYKFCSIGSPLTKDVKYEYHLNFGMPCNAVELIIYAITDLYDELEDREKVIDMLTIMPDDTIDILEDLVSPDYNWLRHRVRPCRKELNISFYNGKLYNSSI